MFDMVSGMFCFVTATVSFLYGTRICWVCGKRCSFDVDPTEKTKFISFEEAKTNEKLYKNIEDNM